MPREEAFYQGFVDQIIGHLVAESDLLFRETVLLHMSVAGSRIHHFVPRRHLQRSVGEDQDRIALGHLLPKAVVLVLGPGKGGGVRGNDIHAAHETSVKSDIPRKDVLQLHPDLTF